MGFLNRPQTNEPKPWREDPFSRFFNAVLITLTGVLLGLQYWEPNKRVIPVVVALLVFGIAWRLSMMAALNLLVFLLPYPKGTVFGSTNLAFVLLVFIIWLLRVSLRMSPQPRRTPIDLPIAAFLLWAVLSFYNVQSQFALTQALINFELLVACILYFYLIVNSVQTQQDLKRFHQAQMVTALGVFLLAAWEARHAGQVLIPGLIDFTSTIGHDFNTRDIRVGSSFRDYELLSEYCGVMFVLSGFLLLRARTQLSALVLSLFTLFNVYTMFTTVTRGVFVALGVALPVGFFMIRRRLNPVRFMTAAVTIAVLAITMNFVVAKYTNTGDVFERLGETKVTGVVPEARADIWANAWNRIFVHPILGQGPFYDEIPGHGYWWPHNVYLYIANLYGFPGLLLFLAILLGLWQLTRLTTDDLKHESYADAYLIVARVQLMIFAINEIKIDFLRNPIYQFQAWQFFGTWVAAYLVSKHHGLLSGRVPASTPDDPPGHRMAA